MRYRLWVISSELEQEALVGEYSSEQDAHDAVENLFAEQPDYWVQEYAIEERSN
tara:strand:- start:1149 stop:1310 length:162 start_codon:yes stop_codon:yes gene_type:complete